MDHDYLGDHVHLGYRFLEDLEGQANLNYLEDPKDLFDHGYRNLQDLVNLMNLEDLENLKDLKDLKDLWNLEDLEDPMNIVHGNLENH